MTDSLEEGYKILAKDPEMYARRRHNHHCGFDFENGQRTAKCVCGAVATNPYYIGLKPSLVVFDELEGEQNG